MIKLPSMFSDGMVLQRGIKVPVWGWSEPAEKIIVIFIPSVSSGQGGQEKTTTADEDGKWMVKLDVIKASSIPCELIVSSSTGNQQVKIKNVLVGEVWICSGQSNMEVGLAYAANVGQEIAAANYPGIRMFKVEHVVTVKPRTFPIEFEPCDNVPGAWAVCNPQNAPDFSAVGYFFARELSKTLDVPIGMINASWGGTPVEAWIGRSTLMKIPALNERFIALDQQLASYAENLRDIQPAIKEWLIRMEETATAKKSLPIPPQLSFPDPRNQAAIPAGLYNGMIAPLIPYGIAGAIWYQGETNVGKARLYRELFPLLITSWREAWRQGDFPFYFVQLSNYKAVQAEPDESEWAELREAQRMTLAIPNTGMAVTVDLGEADDIHPRNKQDVGWRLALLALAQTYGMTMECCGPLYAGHTVEGDKVRVKFNHVGKGLMVKDGGCLKGFAICGEERKYVWAEAMIEDDTVVMRSTTVSRPTAVRYAWADNPTCNLYNKEGLPASPFSTEASIK